MVSRDSRWCVKHYREVFKRALFTQKLDYNVRKNIMERVIQLQAAGFDYSRIVKYIQQEHSQIFEIDIYSCVHHIYNTLIKDKKSYEVIPPIA